MTDGDGAVAKCERGFASVYGMSVLRSRCEVHYNANIRKKVLRPVVLDSTVSMLIHTSLSLNFNDNIGKFRQALAIVIQEGLVFRFGVPLASHGDKLRNLLLLFCNGDDIRSSLVRTILTTLITGDIESLVFEHVCPGCCVSREDCLQKCTVVFRNGSCRRCPIHFQQKSVDSSGEIYKLGRIA